MIHSKVHQGGVRVAYIQFKTTMHDDQLNKTKN
jgi:hypothetical protein